MVNTVADSKNKSDRLPEHVYNRRRAIAALGLVAMTYFLSLAGEKGISAVSDKAHDVVESFVKVKNGPYIPDITDKEAIQEGIESGKLTKIILDDDHPTLWDIAEKINPNSDPREMVDALTKSLGTTIVHTKEEIFVPNTPEAAEIHNSQYPEGN